MDVDPKDIIETAASAREQRSARKARLNATVAITVAVLATFMGICKVKDDNIVQAMQQAQAAKLDHWAFHQARKLRQEVAKSTLVQLELARLGAPASAAETYDALNYRDDQFDMSDALIAIAIAMLAVTALTGLWPRYWASLVPTVFGVLMGVAGLASLPIHPDALVRLLS